MAFLSLVKQLHPDTQNIKHSSASSSPIRRVNAASEGKGGSTSDGEKRIGKGEGEERRGLESDDRARMMKERGDKEQRSLSPEEIEQAKDRFEAIKTAYDVLSNDSKRRAYDWKVRGIWRHPAGSSSSSSSHRHYPSPSEVSPLAQKFREDWERRKEALGGTQPQGVFSQTFKYSEEELKELRKPELQERREFERQIQKRLQEISLMKEAMRQKTYEEAVKHYRDNVSQCGSRGTPDSDKGQRNENDIQISQDIDSINNNSRPITINDEKSNNSAGNSSADVCDSGAKDESNNKNKNDFFNDGDTFSGGELGPKRIASLGPLRAFGKYIKYIYKFGIKKSLRGLRHRDGGKSTHKLIIE